VLGAAAAAMVGTSAVVLGGATAAVGRMIGGAKTPVQAGQLGGGPTTTTGSGSPGTTTTTGAGSASGTKLGPAKDVPVGQAATFTIPATGDPGIVVQVTKGQFVAYDAVCPHAGCQVGYYPANHVLACPCHGSQFQLNTGAVLNGPAPTGLKKLTIVEESDGNLYLR